MPPLAVVNSQILDVRHFDMSSVFFTDTAFFNSLSIGEKTLSLIERFVAALMLLILAPLMLMISFAIRTTMGEGVFYSQTRVGLKGRNFAILKFRSMVKNAEAATGPVLATYEDPRITRLGHFLRKSHLDELPQLINVLKGEMSFVGPRPERPNFVEVFESEIDQYDKRKDVRPGITGLAQICLPYDATAKDKLSYDLFYIERRRSVIFNLMISYYTAKKMITFYQA